MVLRVSEAISTPVDGLKQPVSPGAAAQGKTRAKVGQVLASNKMLPCSSPVESRVDALDSSYAGSAAPRTQPSFAQVLGWTQSREQLRHRKCSALNKKKRFMPRDHRG